MISKYALELRRRINHNHRLTVLNQGNLSNGAYWAVNELVQPMKALSLHADVFLSKLLHLDISEMIHAAKKKM